MRHQFTLLAVCLMVLLGVSCSFALRSINAKPATQPAIAATTGATTPTPAVAAVGFGRVAYVENGNLWVRDLQEDQARQLTNTGKASQPRWSASGELISYCDNDTLHVLAANGSPQKTLAWCESAWSPNDERLVYRTATGAEVINFDTGQVTKLQGGSIWSPDAQQLAYIDEQILPDGVGDLPYSASVSLITTNLKLAQSQTLYGDGTPATAGARLVGWYGNDILFWSEPLFSASLLADGTSLWAVPADGGAPQQIIEHMLPYTDFVAYDADSHTIALVEGIGRETWANKRILLFNLTTGVTTPITDVHMSAVTPAWSPDHKHLAFSASINDQEYDLQENEQTLAERRIWSVLRDGSEARLLTNDPKYRDEAPQWAHDGQHILFVRVDGYGRASLWWLNVNGGEPIPMIGLLGDATGIEWQDYFGHVAWGDFYDWWQPK
jgi:Tol biopolymer transport system component